MPVITASPWSNTIEAIEPLMALLLYQSERRVFGTLHSLKTSQRGRAVIGAGRPFTHRDLEQLLAHLANQSTRPAVHFLPPEVVAHGEDFSAWWQPARIAPMWFAIQGQRFGFRVPWPPLLFVAARQKLWCAALAHDARPEAETTVFHAPLMNIGAEGDVCLGNADPPPDCTFEQRAAWTATVCDTHFAHANHSHTLQLDDGRAIDTERHFQFWRGLEGQERFPREVLVAMGRQAGDWMAGLL